MNISGIAFTFFIAPVLFLSLACNKPEKAPESKNPVQLSAPIKEEWEQQWDSVAAAAKKEGKVSIISNWGPETRDTVIRAIKEKFGIDVIASVAGASQAAQKILAERRAGLYLYDISVHGSNFGINFMKPGGVFEPAESYLILPEVKEPKAWLDGKFPWFDRGQTMIPFFARLDTNLSINTSLVKQGEITSYHDLLDPKWKGKILLKDPTIVGSGSGWFRENGKGLGVDYMKALVKQEPKILEDERLLVEWLARGKYSVLIAGSSDTLNNFIKEGAPITILDPKDSRTLGPSSGIVSMMNRPPHSEAARLLLNWILTREGQTIMTRTIGLPSRRTDVPTEHILPVLIPQPGKKYLEYTEESLAGGDEAIKLSKEIFGPLVAR